MAQNMTGNALYTREKLEKAEPIELWIAQEIETICESVTSLYHVRQNAKHTGNGTSSAVGVKAGIPCALSSHSCKKKETPNAPSMPAPFVNSCRAKYSRGRDFPISSSRNSNVSLRMRKRVSTLLYLTTSRFLGCGMISTLSNLQKRRNKSFMWG